jgi:hypothetical protein
MPIFANRNIASARNVARMEPETGDAVGVFDSSARNSQPYNKDSR